MERTGSVKSPNRVAVYASAAIWNNFLVKILDRYERSGIAVQWNGGLTHYETGPCAQFKSYVLKRDILRYTSIYLKYKRQLILNTNICN